MELEQAQQALQEYHRALDTLRQESGRIRQLPAVPFYLFGMGRRRKLIYQDGRLKDAFSGEVLRQWTVRREVLLPHAYRVVIETQAGVNVTLSEDENGVWVEETGQRTALSQGRLNLPRFEGHPYAPILRALHQELLVNIILGIPVPNFFVYRTPWYRDSAMTAMALQRTGNLGLLQDWIMGLRRPYDCNNAGETEADNLGQALYLISLVSDVSHPLVAVILEELKRFERGGAICGRSDFAEHPVYQTKWAKFGLAALGLPDPYQIPHLADTYSSLFWWAYQEQHSPGPRFSELDYPYLDWAEAHFYGVKDAPLGDRDYPLTWEANASQADYAALSVISPLYVRARLCAPHTWHAAEMFLYLLDHPHRV